jgi:hypothetical protein
MSCVYNKKPVGKEIAVRRLGPVLKKRLREVIKMTIFPSARGWLLLLTFATMTTATAYADSLSYTYMEILNTDPSYNHLCCGGPYIIPEVLPTLGPDGLPMFNPSYPGYAPNPADLHYTPYGYEITWWSPALNSNVIPTPPGNTGTIALPIDIPSDFFPPNGTGSSDWGGGMIAIYSGTLYAPTTELISFGIGSDDSAFAYLDGALVCDDGGVHGFSYGYCVTPFDISAGNHSLELFYDDLNPVQAGIYFSVLTTGVTTAPVPEPGTIIMLGTGLLAISGALKRKYFA